MYAQTDRSGFAPSSLSGQALQQSLLPLSPFVRIQSGQNIRIFIENVSVKMTRHSNRTFVRLAIGLPGQHIATPGEIGYSNERQRASNIRFLSGDSTIILPISASSMRISTLIRSPDFIRSLASSGEL